MNLGELEAAVHRGELPALVARLSCGDGRERLLARALRRERHALEARPALVLPTLQRACVGTPELQPLLEAWATEWAAAKRGPWLKALTAPTYALESALLSQFPDPQTERRPRPGLRVQTHQQPAGYFAIIDDEIGTTHLFPNSGDDSFGEVTRLNKNEVVVAGWCGDYDGVVARLDLTTQQIIWRHEFGRSMQRLQLTPDDQLFVVDGYTGYFLRPADGTLLASFAAPPGTCELSSDAARVMARHNGVCNEFSVALLGQSPSTPRPPRLGGLFAFGFSSDGSLLVAGLAMFNAATGAQLAEIDADPGGYLEGGPPRRGSRVVLDGFIQTGMAGTKRWNAHGAPIRHINTRFAHWHELAFCAHGDLMAIQNRSNQHLEIRDVDSQELRVTSQAVTTKAFIWVGNSAAIAYIAEAPAPPPAAGPPVDTTPTARTVRLLHCDGRDEHVTDLLGVRALRVSCDGASLAVIGPTNVELWNLASMARATAAPSSASPSMPTPQPGLAGVMALPNELQGKFTTQDLVTRPTDELDEWLHQKCGYRVRAHPWRGAYADGTLTIIDERNGSVVAAVACEGVLLPDPTGTRWASRTELFALIGT